MHNSSNQLYFITIFQLILNCSITFLVYILLYQHSRIHTMFKHYGSPFTVIFLARLVSWGPHINYSWTHKLQLAWHLSLLHLIVAYIPCHVTEKLITCTGILTHIDKFTRLPPILSFFVRNDAWKRIRICTIKAKETWSYNCIQHISFSFKFQLTIFKHSDILIGRATTNQVKGTSASINTWTTCTAYTLLIFHYTLQNKHDTHDCGLYINTSTKHLLSYQQLKHW